MATGGIVRSLPGVAQQPHRLRGEVEVRLQPGVEWIVDEDMSKAVIRTAQQRQTGLQQRTHRLTPAGKRGDQPGVIVEGDPPDFVHRPS